MQLNKCPITLKTGFDTYSLQGIKEVFDNKRVPHILPFGKEELNDSYCIEHNETMQYKKYTIGRNKKKKLQLDSENNMYELLVCTNTSSQFQETWVANLHATYYIATHIYKITTLPSAIIYLPSGEPCVIQHACNTNRAGLQVWHKSAIGLTENNTITYQQIGELIDTYCPTAIIQKEHLLKQLVFNYLFSNGGLDATKICFVDYAQNNDVVIQASAALCNTRLFIQDKDMALPLLSEKNNETVTYQDFLLFAKQLGLLELRALRVLKNMTSKADAIKKFLALSFFSSDMQLKYYGLFNNRASRLKIK